MNKKHEVEKLKYRLKLPTNANITLFRNPKEFSYIEQEKINPTHRIILWGLLRKKYCHSKPTYKIKMGKVRIPILAFLLRSEHLYNFFLYMTNKEVLPILLYYIMIAVFFAYIVTAIPIIIKNNTDAIPC